jgi:hypothetical protein
MTKVIHITEQDAKRLHAILERNVFPLDQEENLIVLKRLRYAICQEFGLVWRDDIKNFMKPV